MTVNLKAADLIPIGRSMPLPLAKLAMSKTNRDTGSAEEIRGLSRSIAEVGLLYPLIVKKTQGEDQYEILAGNRRYRALLLLEIATVPCIVVSGETGERGELLRVVENHQRKNLSPLEEAAAVRGLLDLWDLPTVARSLGRSRAWVARRASLTELSENWVLEASGRSEDDSKIALWPPSHLEVIARFPADVQDRMLLTYGHAWRRDIPTLASLIRATSDYQHLLGGAPWRERTTTRCALKPEPAPPA
jgi:ParB/RepB/Spo0J family partition protein